MNSSALLDELRDENTKLKYRLNILKRVSDTAGVQQGALSGPRMDTAVCPAVLQLHSF